MEFDFAEQVDSLDKVPDQFKPLYAAGTDGKFKLGETFKGVREAVTGLNTSLRAARTDADNARKKVVDLTPLSEFGADPAAIKAAFDARVAELTAKGGDAAKAVELVRKEMTTASKAALDAANAKTSAYQGQLYTMMVENTALNAITELKGVPELLMPFIKNQVKVNEADGKFVVVITDEKGDPRYSGVTGQPMTIKELVTGMKADPKFGRLFESENNKGGGGFQPGGGARQPNPSGGPAKSSTDKIAGGLSKYPQFAKKV